MVVTQQQQQTVSVAGGRIDLLIDRSPPSSSNGLAYSGPAISVLCLHGWTLDHRSFDAQLALVSPQLQLVRFDRRGFGSNRLRPCFQTELADVGAIMASLSGPVVLWGVSQGARLALRYWVAASTTDDGVMAKPVAVISQGGHVDGLAIDDPDDQAIPFDRYRQLLAQGDKAAFAQAWGQHPLVVGGATASQRAEMASLINGYTGADLFTEGALPTPMDLRSTLPNLQAPLLVVTGSQETASRQQHASYLADQVPHARLMTIDGGGHLCNITHHDAVNTEVRRWLADNTPALRR